jgi:ribosomal protein L40E
MLEDFDDDLTEAQKQLYRKKKVPHKFCPNCGARNEAEADRCANCGKDISWMKVPESIPAQEAPKQKPRSMPEQRKPVFTWKAILIFILIILAVAALILVIYFTSGKSNGETRKLSPGLTSIESSHPGRSLYTFFTLSHREDVKMYAKV